MLNSTNKNCVLLIVFFVNYASSEWFSSLSQMEDLVQIELDLLSSLRGYIHAEQKRIRRIERLADNYEEVFKNSQINIDKYLGHPINQYQLINRLESKWTEIEILVKKDEKSAFLSNLSSKREDFPSETDKEETAIAIMRLQNTYVLDTHEIAQGSINGLQSSQPLTADDCFRIGRTAYLKKDFYHCATWMTEALQTNEAGNESFSRSHVFEYLSLCMSLQNNFQTAPDITVEKLKMQQHNESLLENLRQCFRSQMKGIEKNNVTLSTELLSGKNTSLLSKTYNWLCRREKNVYSPKIEKRLKCYSWTNNNHPRLILQPVKLEEMWDSPHLVRFYDVVSDHEINVINSLAKPLLHRSTVANLKTGTNRHTSHRVSKSAWLRNSASQVVANVNQRISDVTGLSMTTAEFLQVANYGVGGQYEPHYDFFRTSDVSSGGNTVFLHPGVAVRPIKGSAVFWYNLFPSGDGDKRTLHAACPVLVGIKWVSNKWIHEGDQEFRRQCQLKRNADNRLF